MSRITRRTLGVAAATLAFAGAAHAQSNALTSRAGPPAATTDLGPAIEQGYVPFSVGGFEAFLAEGGFRIARREDAPGGERAALLATAPNGMPFVFVFTQCGRQGCLFVEAIQPLAPKRIGIELTARDVNELNRANPLQVFVTAEADDRLAVRWAMPALVGCEEACVRSAANLYFVASLSVLEALAKASKQLLVEAPFEEDDRFGVAAAMTWGPEALPEAAWGTASGAFAGADLAALAAGASGLMERLTDELGEVRGRPVGATDAFPALLPR